VRIPQGSDSGERVRQPERSSALDATRPVALQHS